MSNMFKQAHQSEFGIIPNHQCSLSLRTPPVSYKIYEGLFIHCRRRFWKWITIDPMDPSATRILKSTSQIHDEEVRHLEYHPRVIHPFSRLRYCWELIMCVVWLIEFITTPPILSEGSLSDTFWVVKNSMDAICFIDVLLWFVTGYYDKNLQVIVLSLRKVARRYICGFFLIDVLSSLPIAYVAKMCHRHDIHIFASLCLLKIARLPTFFRYVNKFSERNHISVFYVRIFRILMSVCLLMAWSTSTVYLFHLYVNRDILLRYNSRKLAMLMFAFKITRCLMVVGTTEKANISNFWMLYEIFFITIGSTLRIIILAIVVQYYKKRSSSRNKYNHRLEQISQYMEYKELPMRLRNKILRYVDFKFRKHIFREEDVLNNLSSVLKHDILLHRCQRMVTKVDFFKDLPAHILVQVVTKLRTEIFLPSDVIVLAGYTGHAMYFICKGTVAIYSANGKEVCHLDDGAHFGEIALLMNEPRIATVVAVKECELFRLNRKDFQEAIEPYPEVYKKIKLLAAARLEKTLQFMAENT